MSMFALECLTLGQAEAKGKLLNWRAYEGLLRNYI